MTGRGRGWCGGALVGELAGGRGTAKALPASAAIKRGVDGRADVGPAIPACANEMREDQR
jgi:hypothetical protein